jgi:nifR3 family TIM-barrel protein
MQKPLVIGGLTLGNNLMLAPMAGVTNLPMRLLCRRFGASLCFTEMVSIEGLVREGRRSFDLLQSTPEDRPLGLQIFGSDPETMARAAAMAEPYGDIIDINMGCPVRKVVASGGGSMLMRDPAAIGRIIKAVRRVVQKPLTVKIRSGWTCSEQTFREAARIAEDEGCDAITLHPRSRSQMFEGTADWSLIGELKELVQIPVIGSGDLFTADDVQRMLRETGCDGVMLARGAMGNPWLFREALQLLAGQVPTPPSPAERGEVARLHLEIFVAGEGERVAVREMRKHLAWYARGVPGAAAFRGTVNSLTTRDDMIRAIDSFFMPGEA